MKEQNLRQLAIDASDKSYSPYSKAKVGSAIIMEDGSVYSGCNVENSSFGGTVCAERVAIWKAISEGHTKIHKIYVYTIHGWPPCGICRQVMSEFAADDLEVIIGDKKGQESSYIFKELSPLSFTPDHLKD